MLEVRLPWWPTFNTSAWRDFVVVQHAALDGALGVAAEQEGARAVADAHHQRIVILGLIDGNVIGCRRQHLDLRRRQMRTAARQP